MPTLDPKQESAAGQVSSIERGGEYFPFLELAAAATAVRRVVVFLNNSLITTAVGISSPHVFLCLLSLMGVLDFCPLDARKIFISFR